MASASEVCSHDDVFAGQLCGALCLCPQSYSRAPEASETLNIEVDTGEYVAVVRQIRKFEAAKVTALIFDRVCYVHVCVEYGKGYVQPIAKGLQSLGVYEVGVVVIFVEANGRI